MIGSLTITQTKPTLIAKASIFQTGPPGPDGPAGPNSVTSATTSDGTADLSVATLNIADGGTLLGPNIDNPAATVVVSRVDGEYARLTVGGLITLDDQTATVSAGFGAFTSRVDAGTIAFTAFEAGAGATFTYGTGSASAHRTALGLGATGSIAASDPLTVTQTWTDAAVTYTGLQVNITDTASNAASLLMDLQVGGVSQTYVARNGVMRANGVQLSGSNGSLSWPNISGASISGNTNSIIFNRGGVCAQMDSAQWAVNTLRVGIGANQTFVTSDSTNTLAQRNGTAAQEFRVYGTYTSSSNYRRLALKMSTTGVAQIVAEGGGSGAAGNVLELPANTTFADSSATRTALGGGATGQAIFQAATTSAAQTAAGFVTLTPAAYANLVATGTADADTIYIVQE